jgi:formate hydrogenlyase subunit 6/NADH:ubiquinone oxidoreductase subunit I
MVHGVCVGCIDTSCVNVCPVDCISKDSKHVEDKESLYEKYLKLIQ